MQALPSLQSSKLARLCLIGLGSQYIYQHCTWIAPRTCNSTRPTMTCGMSLTYCEGGSFAEEWSGLTQGRHVALVSKANEFGACATTFVFAFNSQTRGCRSTSCIPVYIMNYICFHSEFASPQWLVLTVQLLWGLWSVVRRPLTQTPGHRGSCFTHPPRLTVWGSRVCCWAVCLECGTPSQTLVQWVRVSQSTVAAI